MKPSKKGPKKPKVIYGTCINLMGLYSDKPIKLMRDRYLESDYYWDDAGDFDCKVIGTDETAGRIQYSSVNKRDVENWIAGAKAAMKQMAKWATDSLYESTGKHDD